MPNGKPFYGFSYDEALNNIKPNSSPNIIKFFISISAVCKDISIYTYF